MEQEKSHYSLNEVIAVTLVLGLILWGYFFRDRSPLASEVSPNQSGPASPSQGGPAAVSGAKNSPVTPLPESQGVLVQVVRPGTGNAVKAGDTVVIHYTGTLIDGTKFDSSLEREPLRFTLGSGQVITGLEIGLLGDGGATAPVMKIGEKRKLYIPPTLAYGEAGTPGGPIPPNAPLVFEIELLEINPR